MLIINKDTFEQRKKKKGFTNKYIAEAAGVTETTVGKIKKGQNLQAHTVTKIAKALKLTTEQLTSPPEPTSENDLFKKFGNEYLSGASILYNVPESWIIEHASLFFTILAEQSLEQRREKAQQCLSDFKALDNSIFSRDDNFFTSATDDYLDAIHRELKAIEEKDLSGPRDETKNQNAHFINFLIENEVIDMEIFDAKTYDNDTASYTEQGAGLEDLLYYLPVSLDAVWKLLPGYPDSDQELARNIIQNNDLLPKIPKRFRSKNRVDGLVKWAFQWEENRINELLPEHSNKTLNDRRIFAKAILKKYFSVGSSLFFELRSKPDELAEDIIKRHEKRVLEGTHEAFDFEENSNA